MPLLKFRSWLEQEGAEGAALGSEVVTEGGGEGDEVVISFEFPGHELVEGGMEEVGRL